MMQHTTVLCTNAISSMVFAIRPQLLLETRVVVETRLVFKQMPSDPRLVLDTRFVFETRLLLEEIQYFMPRQDNVHTIIKAPHPSSTLVVENTLCCRKLMAENLEIRTNNHNSTARCEAHAKINRKMKNLTPVKSFIIHEIFTLKLVTCDCVKDTKTHTNFGELVQRGFSPSR